MKSILYDEWLSAILEKQTYAIAYSDLFFEHLASTRSHEYQSLAQLQASPVFIYAKIPTINIPAVNLLQSYGFKVIETSLLFQKKCFHDCQSFCGAHIRTAEAVDEACVYALAGRSFSFSRFHLDGAIENALANKIKAEWTRGYFKGQRGDAMLVALYNSAIVGFILLAEKAEDSIVIDLMAIDALHRRTNIASALIVAAERLFKGTRCMLVGTQEANVPSIRLYEKSGFRLSQTYYVLHFHGPGFTSNGDSVPARA